MQNRICTHGILALGRAIATMISMSRYQFTLKQLLVAVVIAAIVLVGIRFAIRSHGLAVGMLAMVVGAVLLLLVNVLTYGFLRSFGSVFVLEPEQVADDPDSAESPKVGASAAAGGAQEPPRGEPADNRPEGN